jgi:hypothetical protein
MSNGDKRDRFFDIRFCERCQADLHVRTMSWFNSDTICMDCAAKENAAKIKLRELGKDPAMYEGYGSIPTEVEELLKVNQTNGGARK